MENAYRDALRSLGADLVDHHGRVLTEHLMGTFNLLVEWGNGPTVSAAGAFHSVYGTEEFKTQAVPLVQRSRIVTIIGAEAEELVYLFCIANRRALYDEPESEPPYVVAPSLGGRRFAISKQQYANLIEVEVANILEQAAHQHSAPASAVRFWLSAFDKKRHLLSEPCRNAYPAVLGDWLDNHAAA